MRSLAIITALLALGCRPGAEDRVEGDPGPDVSLVGATAPHHAPVEGWVPPRRAEWTVLVYLSGDNNLEAHALEDLNEMEEVGSSDRVQVVVQLDRSERYTGEDGDWSGARRYLVGADDDPGRIGSPVLDDLGPVDSGDPEVLEAFLAWGIRTFPAERYAVVFWDHGWGWTLRGGGEAKGFSRDESTGEDVSVATGEYGAVLATAAAAAGAPLDLVGFDACLMGAWEVAHATAPFASVFVASEGNEDLDGWDYTAVLGALRRDPTLDAAALGEAVVDAYASSADWEDLTLSVVDLGALDGFTADLDALAAAALDSGSATPLVEDAQGTLEFQWGAGHDHDVGAWLDAVDADERLPPDVLALAGDLRAAYDEAVLYSRARGYWSAATGLTLHLPDSTPSGLYTWGSWSEDTLWDELLYAAWAD